MKCMGAVESDSVKSARKAEDKLHKQGFFRGEGGRGHLPVACPPLGYAENFF